MYKKLTKFGKSFLWLLGASIFLAQCYRIVAFYAFSVPMEIVLKRDVPIAVFAFALMFLQNNLKTLVRQTLSKFPTSFSKNK